MRSSLKPLTKEEKYVAENNYWVVKKFLQARKLPEDEWFDIVIFRYLLTVENWFRRPHLYKYEFSTIAWRAMSSAVRNERDKQKRQIRTISLEYPVPGGDGITWGDMVTEDNLIFIPYLMEETE